MPDHQPLYERTADSTIYKLNSLEQHEIDFLMLDFQEIGVC